MTTRRLPQPPRILRRQQGERRVDLDRDNRAAEFGIADETLEPYHVADERNPTSGDWRTDQPPHFDRCQIEYAHQKSGLPRQYTDLIIGADIHLQIKGVDMGSDLSVG